MGPGIEVTSIRNIAIRVHPSFLLALAWVVYYWGFSMGHGLRGVVFGLFVLVAVFVCVVGHELAHSFVALRYGLAVHDITLLPIGGVARIEHAALAPRHEATIALAGPILNLVVALGLLPVLLGIAVVRDAGNPASLLLMAQEMGFSGLLIHLWLANVMLALFNLLPAFPMDGGRILRAILTVLSDRVFATRVAVFLGQVLALLLVGIGFYTRDVALPLVSAFILVSAMVEFRLIQVEAALRGLPVGQFALWDMGGVSPSAPLNYALRGGPRDVAVIEDGAVVGMLWRSDILGLVNAGSGLRVRDVMDQSVTPMSVDCSVYEVHRQMLATGRPAIPIIEGANYRGIFTSDRLIHVHRYIQERRRPRDYYRGIAEALGFVSR